MKTPKIIAALRGRADEAAATCAGLSDDQMRQRPRPDAWSLLEICCHLRDNASEEGLRIRRMLEEENPTLVPYDQDLWAAERNYAGEDRGRVFAALRAYWSGLVHLLEGLKDEGWARPGVHPEFGAMTVQSCAEDEVRHTADHLDQMAAVRASISRR